MFKALENLAHGEPRHGQYPDEGLGLVAFGASFMVFVLVIFLLVAFVLALVELDGLVRLIIQWIKQISAG